jgi:hypothetical protein
MKSTRRWHYLSEPGKLCEALHDAIKDGHPPGDFDRLVRSFAQILIETDTFASLDPADASRILELVVRSPIAHKLPTLLAPPDDLAKRLETTQRARTSSPIYPTYMLLRQIYPLVRGAESPLVWNEENTALWRSMFLISLYAGNNRQLAFASQLYTDYLSDGMRIPDEEAIAMIYAITASPMCTKSILLERHVKDYEWVGHESKDSLLQYLVAGLCRLGRTNDAHLAFVLSRQMLGISPFTMELAKPILEVLVRRPTQINYKRAIEVLHSVTATPSEMLEGYNDLIYRLVVTLPRLPRGDTLSRREGIAWCLASYKDMLARGITPDGTTLAYLVIGYRMVHRDEAAIEMVKAGLKVGSEDLSRCMGDLIVRFVNNGQTREAKDLVHVWVEAKIRIRKESVVKVVREGLGLQDSLVDLPVHDGLAIMRYLELRFVKRDVQQAGEIPPWMSEKMLVFLEEIEEKREKAQEDSERLSYASREAQPVERDRLEDQEDVVGKEEAESVSLSSLHGSTVWQF